MENDFWNRRKEEKQDHCVIEYKKNIRYVYACKCDQCLTPITTLKPQETHNNLSYERLRKSDVGIDEQSVLYENKEIPKSSEREKSVHWKLKSNQRRVRKQNQVLVRKLLTNYGIQV